MRKAHPNSILAKLSTMPADVQERFRRNRAEAAGDHKAILTWARDDFGNPDEIDSEGDRR